MPSSGSNTQIQKTEPSDWTKGWLQPGLEEAQSLFKEGMPAHYTDATGKSTVAGFSPQSEAALTSLYDQGMNGKANRANQQYALDKFGEGALMDMPALGKLRTIGDTNSYALNPATAGFEAMASAGPGTADRLLGRTGDIVLNGGNVGGFTDSRIGDLSTGGPNTLAQFRSDVGDIISGQAQGANPAYTSLGLTASGARLNSDPFLDATYGKAADAVTRSFRTAVDPGIDGKFAMTSGGSTSGARLNEKSIADEALGRSLSGLATDVYGGNYQAERARQDAAAATLGSLYQSGLGLRTSAAGTSAGQGTADASTRLAATGQVAGDLSGDLARKQAAANALTGAETSDFAQKLNANQALGSLYESGADRQIAATKAANDVYNAGRAQQLQALGLQPTFQDMDYRDLEAAMGAGQARDTQAQNELNADISRYDYTANAPRQNVANYLAMVNGGTPGTTTSMTNSGGNPFASLLAGAGGMGQLAMALKGLGLF